MFYYLHAARAMRRQLGRLGFSVRHFHLYYTTGDQVVIEMYLREVEKVATRTIGSITSDYEEPFA